MDREKTVEKGKKWVKFFLKLAVSLALLVWVIFKVNWNETWNDLQRVQLWQIALYLLLVVSGIAISSHKWRLLARQKNIDLPFSDFFKFYLTGTFVNNFMPSFIGGDTYRAYQIGRPEKKYAQAASTVVVDRITGLVAAMILALLFGLSDFHSVSQHRVLVLVNLIVAAALVAVFVVLKLRNLPLVGRLAARFLPEKIMHFFQELQSYTQDHGVLWRSTIWGIWFSLVGMAMANYVLLLSLGVSIHLLDYLSVIFLITIVSSIPISINNIGLKEWAYVTFFGYFGANTSLVIIASILGRFLQMALSFIALPMYLKTRKMTKDM